MATRKPGRHATKGKASTRTKGTKRRIRPLGPIGIVGGLLVASAALRVGLMATSAIAAAEPPAEHEPPAEPPLAEAAPADGIAPLCTSDTDLQRVLDALRAREERIIAAEADIAARSEAVAALEHEAQSRVSDAMSAEDALKKTMALADAASETDLAQLASVYERMKPPKAAALFETMQPEFAAGFLGRMRPDSAAQIMAAMNSDKAYAISVILAGRNANAGKVPESH